MRGVKGAKQTVTAIGNFDGVHRGHRDLLTRARGLADDRGLDLCVVTFAPHPRQVFQPNIAPFRLTSDPLRERLLRDACTPDQYQALAFNDELRAMSADAFMRDILTGRCNAAAVVVGDGFRFGNGRKGDVAMLRSCPAFETVAHPLMILGGEPVSSSRIRDHLKNAEMQQANALLGWEWFFESEVVHGDKRGRELGYPTANMHFGDTIVPAHGVYAVRVRIEGEKAWRHGAANIGIRPMFETRLPMCETYIFDFDGDLYGQILTIQPVQKLRDEMKFDRLDDLIRQMGEDCKAARNVLSSR